MPLNSGDQIGPYEILGPLGKGGMGEVYRARDTRLGREVALKLLAETSAQDSDHLARFERETRAVAALNHPNILAIHDTGSHRGVPYAVTELLEGETVAERLHSGPLAAKRAVDIACQIADGLSGAHTRGIIHRDIKPENIFLTHEGRAKILDFGIARMEHPTVPFGVKGARPRGTSAQFIMGTAGYMSPEQVRGKPIDPRTDIFSLGATFFEMLTGRQAFQRESAVETSAPCSGTTPASFPRRRRSRRSSRRIRFPLPREGPGRRYQSARDFVLDLRAYQAESAAGVRAAGPVRESEPPWKHRKTRLYLRAVGGGPALSAGALGRRLLAAEPIHRGIRASRPGRAAGR